MSQSATPETPRRGASTVRTFPYPDTTAVAEFMTAFGQPVRTTPTDDLDPTEAELRVRLVVEEAIEFATAMGYNLVGPDGAVVGKKTFEAVAHGAPLDLVEAADALADLTVVVKGSAHTLGIDLDSTFIVVHGTNMAKMHPVTGKPVRDARGKVTKPEGWVPPTEAIKALLVEDGWTPRNTATVVETSTAETDEVPESTNAAESSEVPESIVASMSVKADFYRYRNGD